MSSLLAKFREVTQGGRGNRDQGNRSAVVPVVVPRIVAEMGTIEREAAEPTGWTTEDVDYTDGSRVRWYQSPCGEYRISEDSGMFELQHGRGVVRTIGRFPALADAIAEYETITSKPQPAEPVATISIPGFFPTPKTLAAELVELASIGDGDHVLEPSAGIGSLAEAVIESGVKPGRLVLCEVRSSLCEVLRLKGIDEAEVRECDFLEQSPSEVIDRIVMNPPFENGQDAEHVRHAFKFLKDGGRLVAIVSAGLFFRQDKKATGFREWLEEVQGEVIEVDPKHYRSAEAFRQTGANCKIVVIEK